MLATTIGITSGISYGISLCLWQINLLILPIFCLYLFFVGVVIRTWANALGKNRLLASKIRYYLTMLCVFLMCS